ncbi:hypothetical protein ABKA04_008562 [Annulohypoxylon sp. FPYF3050]
MSSASEERTVPSTEIQQHASKPVRRRSQILSNIGTEEEVNKQISLTTIKEDVFETKDGSWVPIRHSTRKSAMASTKRTAELYANKKQPAATTARARRLRKAMARRSQTPQTPQTPQLDQNVQPSPPISVIQAAPAEVLAPLAQSNAEQVVDYVQGIGINQAAPAAQAIPAISNDTLARRAATVNIEENDIARSSQTTQAAPARDDMEAVASCVGQQGQVSQPAIQAHRTAQGTQTFRPTAMRTYGALARRDTGEATGRATQSRGPQGYLEGTQAIPVATYAAPAGGRVGQGQYVQSQTYGAPVQRGAGAVVSRITQGQGDQCYQGTQAQQARVASAGTYAAPARGHVAPARQRVGAVAGHGQGQDHRGARADQGQLATQMQPQGNTPIQVQTQAPQAAWAPLVLERITHIAQANGLMYYRVKWVGLNDNHSTWIPEPVVLAHYWHVIDEFFNSLGYNV